MEKYLEGILNDERFNVLKKEILVMERVKKIYLIQRTE